MAVALIGDSRQGPAPARRARLAPALLATTALFAQALAASPAAAQTPGAAPTAASIAPDDPMEGLNRLFYKLHQAIDRVLLRPAAFTYQRVTPKVVRKALHNFLGNLEEPLVFANDVLQLRLAHAGKTLVRFATDSTFGVGGLYDPATKAGFEHHDNDFGETMAHYGVAAGPYVFLPLLGPSTLRDLIGSGVEFAANPLALAHYNSLGGFNAASIAGALTHHTTLGAFNAAAIIVGGLDQRVAADEDLRQIDQMGTDSYATLRSLYLQSRQAQINGGADVDIQTLPQFDDSAMAPSPAAPPATSAPSTTPAPSPASEAPVAPSPTPASPAAPSS